MANTRNSDIMASTASRQRILHDGLMARWAGIAKRGKQGKALGTASNEEWELVQAEIRAAQVAAEADEEA